MGVYLGVKAVEAKAKLIRDFISKNRPAVPSGKRLIAVTQNGYFKIAGDVTHPAEYAAMYRAVVSGDWLGGKLYLLDESLVKECPDEGRVKI